MSSNHIVFLEDIIVFWGVKFTGFYTIHQDPMGRNYSSFKFSTSHIFESPYFQRADFQVPVVKLQGCIQVGIAKKISPNRPLGPW